MNKEKIYNQNFLYGVLEVVFFVTAINMIDPSTVLPLFITLISGSPIIIGFITTIFNAGPLFPQIFFYKYIEKKKDKKAAFIKFATLRSSTWGLAALFIVLFPTRYILLQYLLMFVVFLYTFFLSIEDMAWSDVIAKSIDSKRRGSFLGVGSLWGSALGIGVGFFVKWLLSENAPLSFPYNFALIFSLASLSFFGSVIVFSFIKIVAENNQDEEKEEEIISPIKEIPYILKNNVNFLIYILVNFFLNAFLLSLPFFLLYARNIFSIPDKEVGFFVMAQTIGRAIFVYIIGKIGDSMGHKVVLVLSNILTLTILIIAIFTPLFAHFISPKFVFYIIFFLSGAALSGKFVSSINYLLDIAPPNKIPAFRGISSSFIGISLLIFPASGGFLLKYTSYNVLFLTTLFFLLVSTSLSFVLKNTTRLNVN